MLRSVLFLLAGGCPYLFEPPDESNVVDRTTPSVDGGDADADADSDADTDADSDVPGAPPFISSFEVVPRLTGVSLYFSIADQEQDFVGGWVHATDGTDLWDFEIPGGLDHWDPQGISQASIVLGGVALGCATPSIHQTWTIWATDYAQHDGDEVGAEFNVTALGTFQENGDRWPDDAHTVDVDPPFMGCVIYDTDHPPPPGTNTVREQLFRNVEGMVFVTPETRDYRFMMNWAPAADIDLYILPFPITDIDPQDGNPDVSATSLTYSMPEELVMPANAGDTWLFDPTFFDLAPGTEPPYTAFFLVAPN